MKIAIYARISTSDKGQDADNQLNVLREYCKQMNYTVVNEYTDKITGGTSDRPAFKQMFADASQKKFDLVLFWSLDRLTREGTRATIKYLEVLESYKIAYKSYTEQYIDSCGIFKDVVISLLSTLAKQEKIRISERVKAGLARTTKKGGQPKIDEKLIQAIKIGKTQGKSNRQIATELDLSHTTVGIYAK